MPDVNSVVRKQIEAAFSRATRTARDLNSLDIRIRNIQKSNYTEVKKLEAVYLRLHWAALDLEQAKALIGGAQAFAIVAEKMSTGAIQ